MLRENSHKGWDDACSTRDDFPFDEIGLVLVAVHAIPSVFVVMCIFLMDVLDMNVGKIESV